MIIVIGDSHVQQFIGKPSRLPGYPKFVEREPFKTFWIGPRTCWKVLPERAPLVETILRDHWREGDWMVFSFGEIDMRRHVLPHVTEDRPIEKVAIEVGRRYLDLLRQYSAHNPIALGLPPQKDALQEDYDPRGTVEERKLATKAFNGVLERGWVRYWPSPGWAIECMSDRVHCRGDSARDWFVKRAKELPDEASRHHLSSHAGVRQGVQLCVGDSQANDE